MKNLLSLSVILVLCHFILESQPLPEVFSAIPVTIMDGHSGPAFANDIRDLDEGLQKFGKGVGAWVSYGDRGERKGKMSWGFTFDLKEVRDYYFPTSDGDAGAYPKFGALMAKMQANGINTSLTGVEEESGYTDYVCVGFDALDNPQLGELVAVRALAVKPGSEKDFEAYVVSDLYHAFNHVPGVDAYVFLGDRGENKGGYIVLYSFESVELRNTYFPSDGEGPAEAHVHYWNKATELTAGMSAFIDTANAPDTYTDYVSINRAPAPNPHRSALEELNNQEVYWFLELTINEGKKEDFMAMMKDMVMATKKNEPGTLNYEWNMSGDGKTCYLYERYADSAAAMSHIQNFGANFAERWGANTTVVKFTLCGAPNDEVVQALSGAGAKVQKPIGGFAR